MVASTSRSALRSNKKRADRAVAAWNRDHAPGIKVELCDDDGKRIETMTRSQAWEAGGHAVVLVEGRTGGYLLSRITPT